MRSSYFENNYAEVIKAQIRLHNPATIVELGILDGYSTLAIAQAIKEFDKVIFDSYDLFEDYEFKHGSKEAVEELLRNNNVLDKVNIIKGDAYKVQDNYKDNSVDFLHVDISNTGDVIRNIMNLWHPKMSEQGVIIIEGGSEERDNVDWMIKYNKPSIKKELKSNSIIKEFYDYMTITKFPSMTILMKKNYDFYGYGW